MYTIKIFLNPVKIKRRMIKIFLKDRRFVSLLDKQSPCVTAARRFCGRGDEPICYRGALCQLSLSNRAAQLFSHTMKPVSSRLLVSPESFAGRTKFFCGPRAACSSPLFYGIDFKLCSSNKLRLFSFNFDLKITPFFKSLHSIICSAFQRSLLISFGQSEQPDLSQHEGKWVCVHGPTEQDDWTKRRNFFDRLIEK